MEFIEIDGSYMEGGGQILRTSVSLSALTQKPVKIINIRKNRRNPGLAPQHVAAIKAVKKLCNAEVYGLNVGSMEIIFIPSKISPKNFLIDIGTAGSISLIIQTIVPLALGVDKAFTLKIRGGTDVRMSPPIDYVKNITLKILKNFGVMTNLKVLKRGFYPKGGGEVVIEIKPSKIKNFDLIEHSKCEVVEGISYVQNLNENIARRMRKRAVDLLNKEKLLPNIKIECSKGISEGAGIVLWNDTIGGSCLGEKGLRAEIVAERAVNELLNERKSGMALDKYMGDQIIPYLALGGGTIGVSEITSHTKTNMWVVKHFLNVNFEITPYNENDCKGFTITANRTD
ncbi:RNA 3'-phosphate cyclase [Methanocaldococcus vulcanius M7]|uniref:RNA 3'-terminal phosphate cyclase n=1 Tax=Methanocaldococcus vulcanius (strain ATCC 700851 / DSM 12094 / M7) TaxID=579137 RepID=C9RGW4_METVM|nr:RNA 3'-terminal phosphate cyclase [Methanocaldococcus vulcanius]ACX72816.1 RNA 3'-phosphate cyclase [Methanocaldococcus vulcanius M7]